MKQSYENETTVMKETTLPAVPVMIETTRILKIANMGENSRTESGNTLRKAGLRF